MREREREGLLPLTFCETLQGYRGGEGGSYNSGGHSNAYGSICIRITQVTPTPSYRSKSHPARANCTPGQNTAHQHSGRNRSEMDDGGYDPAGRQRWYHYPGYCSAVWEQRRTYQHGNTEALVTGERHT